MKLRIRISKGRLLAVLLAVSAGTSLLGPVLAGRVRPLVATALMPFGHGGMYLVTSFRSAMRDATEAQATPEEVRSLREENAALRNYIDASCLRVMEQLLRRARQAEAFRGLFAPDQSFCWEMIPARVVLADPVPYGSTLTINAGRTSGVSPAQRVVLTDRSKALPDGMAAVAGDVLVGKVIDAGAYAARIQLVTDVGFRLRGRIIRNLDNPRTIVVPPGREEPLSLPNRTVGDDVEVRGSGAGGLVVENVRAYHNVLPGDFLVTREEEFDLPVQVRLGVVTEVTAYPQDPQFVMLRARPAADLDMLREVHVVVPAAP